MTEKEWVKMLFNAKTKAEEEHWNNRLNDWKPVIYESQIDGMKSLWGNAESWERMESWLRNGWDVIDDKQRRLEQQESWRKIHEMLDKQIQDRINMVGIAPKRSGKTWLGSQIEHCIIDEHVRIDRVEEDLSVPGIRGFGRLSDQTWLDRASYTPESYHGFSYRGESSESDPALEEWLQRRSICFRASSCGVA